MLAIGRAGEQLLQRVDAAVEDADTQSGVARQEMRPIGTDPVGLVDGEAIADGDDVIGAVEPARLRERRLEAMVRLTPAERGLVVPADPREIAGQRLELRP